MPNAKVLSEKQAVVAALAERLQNASAGVFVDYKGINVAEDTELRAMLRERGIEYTVIKNTLTRFAIKQVGFEELDPVLNGTTSLATSVDDPIAPVRAISEYARKLNGKFEIKAGFVEGKLLSLSELAEIAELGSKEALYAKVLGTMLAPITSLAVVLSQIIEKNGAPASAESAEETPAAEVAAETPAAETTEETPPEAETAETAAETPAAEEAPAEEAAE